MSYIRILEARIPLDNKYDNVIAFKDLYNSANNLVKTHITRDDYFKGFDSHYNDISTYIKYNLRYGDSLTSKITITSKMFGSSIKALNGYNYIHAINDENPRYPRNLYFFITGMNYRSGDVVELYIETDIFTTYFRDTCLDYDLRPIFTERCHCDRFQYNDTFGCDEALLPDAIDSQFGANILENHNKIFNGDTNLWAVVIFANNCGYQNANSTQILDSNSAPTPIGEVFLHPATDGNNYSAVKSIPTPYVVALIPINKVNLTLIGGVYHDTTTLTMDYGFSRYKDFLLTNAYIMSIQVTTFNFTEALGNGTIYLGHNANLNPNIGVVFATRDAKTQDTLPIFCLKNFESISQVSNINIETILGTCNYDNQNELSKASMLSATSKLLKYEPKLYTPPYCHFTYTSALEKEYEFIPFLVKKDNTNTINFEKTFTPNPNNNGEMTFIKNGDYYYTKANYNGAVAIANSEIPIANSSYQNFLASQKNSYYTGLGLSFFNNILGIGTGATTTALSPTVSGKASGIISSVQSATDIVATPFKMASKMKDLQATPNKIANGSFDIYSAYNNADLYKYYNTYTLIYEEQLKAFDYFYLNGYQVEMFRELKYNADYTGFKTSKNSVFTRRLFDFIKINEDVTNKIAYQDTDGSEPLTSEIRSKLNSLLNRGIRIWFIDNTSDFMNFTLENKEIN